MSLARVRREAQRLLLEVGIDSPPVDLKRIATALGLKVVSADLGADVSGLLVRTAEGSRICVASGDPITRRRFTIAHEIGHHVLSHQFEPGEHVHVDRGNYISQRGLRASQGVDPKEIEANHFAACLLMPAPLVEREVEQLRSPHLVDTQVTALAEKFRVSEQAMTIRLTALGFL